MGGVTSRPISADFDKEFVTDAYSHLHSKHSILLYDFIRGYAVLHIKNTPGDLSSEVYKPLGGHGHMRLEGQFSKPLKYPTVVFIQGRFSKSLTISSARDVHYE